MGEVELRYGGRTISLQVVINTDENIDEVMQRVELAAKGPKKAMALVLGQELDDAKAKMAWTLIFQRGQQEGWVPSA